MRIPQQPQYQQKEIRCGVTNTNNTCENTVFFQVPIDINWEFNFQDSIVPSTIINTNQFQSQSNDFDLFFESDFCVDSPSSEPSESSPRSDDFVLNVDNLDFDTFNSFLVEELQFC
eukprot:gnl/Spiro4/7867_TR4139_c0_g1_i1.p1 gnl/Spiro4/7867_TR4139_c0_g1~~gnl/Spiro4/7867_TR4139_c0_g1_i1.p1  ORF type:complete len:116 (-),score=11.52 gnl/Spiro4/7867_TR4139_c0_g1_i1:86-433(-)